eukprot:scaffold3712_cov191-Pinguiococcus_pyrenoidosus.AAC.1
MALEGVVDKELLESSVYRNAVRSLTLLWNPGKSIPPFDWARDVASMLREIRHRPSVELSDVSVTEDESNTRILDYLRREAPDYEELPSLMRSWQKQYASKWEDLRARQEVALLFLHILARVHPYRRRAVVYDDFG